MSASLQNISPRYQEPPRASIVALIWLAQSFALLDDVGSCGPWKNMMCNLLVEIEFRSFFLVVFLFDEKNIPGFRGKNCFLIDFVWSAVCNIM